MESAGDVRAQPFEVGTKVMAFFYEDWYPATVRSIVGDMVEVLWESEPPSRSELTIKHLRHLPRQPEDEVVASSKDSVCSANTGTPDGPCGSDAGSLATETDTSEDCPVADDKLTAHQARLYFLSFRPLAPAAPPAELAGLRARSRDDSKVCEAEGRRAPPSTAQSPVTASRGSSSAAAPAEEPVAAFARKHGLSPSSAALLAEQPKQVFERLARWFDCPAGRDVNEVVVEDVAKLRLQLGYDQKQKKPEIATDAAAIRAFLQRWGLEDGTATFLDQFPDDVLRHVLVNFFTKEGENKEPPPGTAVPGGEAEGVHAHHCGPHGPP